MKTATKLDADISERINGRGMPKADAAAVAKYIRAEVKRTGSDCTVQRQGTGKYQLVLLFGKHAEQVATWMQRHGFCRTPLSGNGTDFSPISMNECPHK